MKQKLIVDAQLFQTANWNRGMGRYAFSLLTALDKTSDSLVNREVVFLLSEYLPQDGEWKDEILKHFPLADFKSLPLLTPSQSTNSKDSLKINKQKISEYIAKLKAQEIEYLIPALLDDLLYCTFPNQENVKKYLVFHDLIPLLFADRYLENRPEYEEAYYRRLLETFNADKILTNSYTTARDLAYFLQIPEQKLFPVLGGAHPFPFAKQPKVLNDKDDFVLAVLGDDFRKNVIGAATAFSIFQKSNPKFRLVLTSHYGEQTKEKIRTIVSDVLFVGSVSDSELAWLYINSRVVLFTSEYEGLGMPLLEAMSVATPVVCSDIDVFREIATADTAYFADPHNVDVVASQLQAAVIAKESHKQKEERLAILDEYSWEAAGKRFASALEAPFATKAANKSKKKIAIVGPTAESICTIGKFIQEHYAIWNDRADVDYFIEDSPTTPSFKKTFLRYAENYFPIETFTEKTSHKYDKIIYHVGNSDFHFFTTRLALAHPATLVMHDINLTGLWTQMEQNGVVSTNRLRAEEYANNSGNNTEGAYIASLARGSKELIVHSQYSAENINRISSKESLTVLQLPIPSYGAPLKHANSRKLTIGLGGILTLDKGLPLIGELLTDSRFSDVNFRIFGHKTNFDGGLLDTFALDSRVTISTNLSDLDYINELSKTDILLNYRPRYHGEASRATQEAMRLGVVPVVRNVGWFAELPDAATVKVDKEEDIAGTLAILLQKGSEEILGKKEAAIKFIQEDCSIENYIDKLLG